MAELCCLISALAEEPLKQSLAITGAMDQFGNVQAIGAVNEKIEGYFETGQSVVLIEDLISSGKSSLEAVSALRESGMNVKGLVSIFTYGFDAATQNFNNADCDFISLCDYDNMLPQAVELNYITETDMSILKDWRKDPSVWKK